ncbi:EAL domain-containing protein [Herbaspirillum sp. LeCh32-8]|uniref:bifunctional diguanylate cyclase/phosphodiesterase n=1 Tax=Herbaspirillum sp. LeCh32-8 TaxID=2821356 RepID=UPI001AEA739B|nr:EAL domain-containing protein [Herbaspirillum sp. LeCh32-8]MBP0598046.1 EAL domain-containing protein [Herbaspirillum sp. LeCh32-8]
MHRESLEQPGFSRSVIEWSTYFAVLLFTALLIANFVWSERRLINASETSRMQLQAHIIEENLAHQFLGVRNALEAARSAAADDRRCNAECERLLLRSLKSAMPGVRAIVLLDAEGRITRSADDIEDRHLDDRDFLSQIARMYSRKLMYVSQPYENTPGVFNIKLSMPIMSADGRIEGAVSAILNPDYFDAVMRSALYADDMNSAITGEDGRRLLFVPANAAKLRSSADDDDFLRLHLRGGAVSSVLRASAPDGERRMAVQRTVTQGELGLDKTFVISLSRSVARINAGWHELALSYLVMWCVFGLLGALALVLMQRRRRALGELTRQREAHHAELSERMELALSGANLGLWDWHIPSDARRVDARGNAMLGYAADCQFDAPGEWRAMVNPEQMEALNHALKLHLADSAQSFEAEYQMRHKDGHWVWIQCRGKVVQRDAQGRPLRMVGTRMDISARKEAEEEIARLAYYDGLTNLPNRRLLLDRLEHAVARCGRAGYHGAVIFVDLDNFKSLNDTMGHDVGDRLLELVALRLKQVTREVDTVARLGGDEFVVLLEDLGADAAEAENNAQFVCRKILASLNAGYTMEGYEVRSTPSLGVVLFGAGRHSVNDLLRQADMAMYEAKAAGRNTYRFFSPDMQEVLDQIAMLETDLRHALVRHELLLHYQPIVGSDGKLSGVEALMRWHHPRRGLVYPGAFIAQAEKSGLIVEFGEWALATACEQLVEWAADASSEPLTIAVNVSARQFRQPDFTQRVLEILNRTGANPRRLKLELTESMLLTDVDDLICKMGVLKEVGVSFSLDDFGTGYSSLSYLKKLPLDQLKIDRSFVQDMLLTPHASSIVRTIVSLAHSMGLNVVAEGVETAEQWAALRKIGCTTFQGYLFGKPAPREDIAAQFLLRGDQSGRLSRQPQLALVSPFSGA